MTAVLHGPAGGGFRDLLRLRNRLCVDRAAERARAEAAEAAAAAAQRAREELAVQAVERMWTGQGLTA